MPKFGETGSPSIKVATDSLFKGGGHISSENFLTKIVSCMPHRASVTFMYTRRGKCNKEGLPLRLGRKVHLDQGGSSEMMEVVIKLLKARFILFQEPIFHDMKWLNTGSKMVQMVRFNNKNWSKKERKI